MIICSIPGCSKPASRRGVTCGPEHAHAYRYGRNAFLTPEDSYKTAIVLNDLHIPFEDAKALALALDVADALQPDKIVLNGDVADCWQISQYVKNPKLHTVASLKQEIETTRGFLEHLRFRFPGSEIVYIFGNHEYRWQVYISKNAGELFGLKGLTLEEQLGLDALGIKVVNSGNRENSWQWGNLVIGHFDRVSKHSAMTAKALIDDKAISLIQAHTHRGGSSYRRLYDRDIVGYENFCLCNRNPEYVDRPNWQLGFSTVVNDGHRFHVTQHPIVDGDKYVTWFNGREYSK